MSEIDFGLKDDEYWTDPQRTAMAVAEQLWALGTETLAVGAPQRVVLEHRETLPLLAYRGGTYRELWASSFEERAVVVAVDVDHNRVHLGPINTEELEPPDPPLDPAEAPDGTTTDVGLVDLRAAMELPWEPAHYLVSVLMRERSSNRTPVELLHLPGSFTDPEVERHQAQQRAQVEPQAISPTPGRPFPSFDKLDGSPPIPKELGIALQVERVVTLREGARCLLHGAFRLPVRAEEIVKNPDRLAGASSADPPSAVLRVTLLATRSESGGASLMTLDVPTWDPANGPGAIVTGHFALDLLEHRFLSGKKAQTHFIYAIAGPVMSGPAWAALVKEGAR
ncbi:MAG: hypothetical protein IPG45_25980 [Deltaproteobacteria bacterium]|jgi:hypothetical protein|nr:hypothetical protein [Deltaproteobacteria bacterium]